MNKPDVRNNECNAKKCVCSLHSIQKCHSMTDDPSMMLVNSLVRNSFQLWLNIIIMKIPADLHCVQVKHLIRN